MAHLTPEEEATRAASPAWHALPSTRNRHAEVLAAVRGRSFDADGMTAALQAFAALQEANPIPDVIEAIERGLIR